MLVSAYALREDRSRLQPVAPAGNFSRGDLRRVVIAVGIALVFGMALVMSFFALPAPQQNSPAAAPRVAKPAWMDIQKPFRLFGLVAPDWPREPTSYAAQRHREGGGRQDHLSFGAFGADAAWLHLTFYRIGKEEPVAGSGPFYVDMARRAAPAGLAVSRMGQPFALKTRFGPVEAAELTLSGAGGAAGQSAQCLGFRLAGPAKVMQIGGFACGAPGKAMDRRRLACTIDRVDLIAAGDDTEMRQFFIGADARDSACSHSRPTPGARSADASGPDEGTTTALRGSSGFTIVR